MALREAGEAREAVLDRMSGNEQALVLRACEENGPGSMDSDWLIVDAALSAAERIEKAASASTGDMKHMVETLVSMLQEHRAEPPPVAMPRMKRTPRMYPPLRRLVKLRERLRVTLSRASSAYALGIIAIAVVALLSWLAGATVTEARAKYANAAVATLLTTPAGHAALHLLETNGDGLPANLSRCRPYVEHGRKAMTCELWAQSAGGVLRHDTILSLAWDRLNDLPAWPFLSTAIVAIAFLMLRRESTNQTVRVR